MINYITKNLIRAHAHTYTRVIRLYWIGKFSIFFIRSTYAIARKLTWMDTYFWVFPYIYIERILGTLSSQYPDRCSPYLLGYSVRMLSFCTLYTSMDCFVFVSDFFGLVVLSLLIYIMRAWQLLLIVSDDIFPASFWRTP